MNYIKFTTEELQNEIWKDIEGFETRYQISNLGRVKSLVIYGRQKSPIVMKPNPHKQGYLLITLILNRKKYYFYIHHLVLNHFKIKKPTGLECNHKNGIKNDNRIENLEWTTPKKNIEHSIKTGLRNTSGENNPKSKLTVKDVIQIKVRLKGKEYQKDIAKDFGVSQAVISDINNNKIWRNV